MPFGAEKLEWCGYPTVKKIEDMFIRFDIIHECDERTDTRKHGHRKTTKAALDASIAGQKCNSLRCV